ncbi:MAG TPA: hypothetical protein VIO61_10600 [Anaerolineaceae bacterium]
MSRSSPCQISQVIIPASSFFWAVMLTLADEKNSSLTHGRFESTWLIPPVSFR